MKPDAKREDRSRPDKTAIRMGAMLLGLYAALHLATAGVIRLVTGQDAAALLAPNAPVAAATAARSREAGDLREPKEPSGRLAASAERSPDCKPGRPFGAHCNFD